MRIRLLFAAVAALALAACNDSSSAPRLSPTKPTRDVECRSGYHIATREDGTESCEEDKDTFDPLGATTTPLTDAPLTVPPFTAPVTDAPPVTTPAAAVPLAPKP